MYCTVLYSPADEVAHPVRLLEELPVPEPARAHDHLVQVLALGQRQAAAWQYREYYSIFGNTNHPTN